MTDTPTQIPPEKAVKRRALFFPLTLKVVFVVLISQTPLLIMALVAAGAISIPNMPLAFLRTGVLHFGSLSVPVSYVVIFGSIALGLGLGVALADVLFISPARRFLRWLLALRSADFRVVPPLPHTGRDEIGEAIAQMAFAAANFSRSTEQHAGSTEQRSLFITTAAHQLRTPLTALLWTVDALRNPATAADEKEKLLKSTEESLSRMRLVIEHILASANVEEGKFGYVFERIDIVPIIEKLINESRALSEKQQIALTFKHEDAFPVFADRERIALALSDLISNALQYTPQGGSVTVSVTPVGEKLEIAVEDTGIGISEAERPLLFGKLYRGERARHMRPDGTGLGLFVVRNIIEKHGSAITVDSTEGKGSRFSFFLNSTKKPSAA
ncbi:MAG: hypothetical protein A2854_01005 [Parcubacteria group bacterium RIFCSPHIGHO2_01_FULL_56_18]|nr:MAG: hypothetical protein A2854_01005 [Parcubacteria group bacterium RIFCSPHIGHO2_01_FULL_56_18]